MRISDAASRIAGGMFDPGQQLVEEGVVIRMPRRSGARLCPGSSTSRERERRDLAGARMQPG
jgi:hypothetical protein